jgi:lipid-binding SYLF domain-containing protein
VKATSAWIVVVLSLVMVLRAAPVSGQTHEAMIVDTATAVLDGIMAVPVTGIPQSLLAGAEGVAIVPNVIKLGFVVGVRQGRGVVLVRDETGAWGPPSFITLTGGSVGWQAGIQSTDVVLVFKSRKSVAGLMRGNFTLGADASVAAGPVGRNAAAATDLGLGAEIYSYSRSRGLFAGVALDGSAIQIDYLANRRYYGGPGAVPGATQTGQVTTVPPSAGRLIERLASYSAKAGMAMQYPVSGRVPGPAGPVDPSQSVRQRLAANASALYTLLDDHWKSYLALPREVFSHVPPPTPDALGQSLKRYDAVAGDPRYRALAQRPEFLATHQLLKQYFQERTASAGAPLKLPAPPSDPNPAASPLRR